MLLLGPQGLQVLLLALLLALALALLLPSCCTSCAETLAHITSPSALQACCTAE
jgi:hypothetical protein